MAEELVPKSHFSRIVVTGHPEKDISDLIRRGTVFQRILKPFANDDLQQAVMRGIDHYAAASDRERLDREYEEANRRLALENAYLKKRLTSLEGFGHVVGDSPQIRDALDPLARVVATDVRVHIAGETGTGKELVARSLHLGGARAQGPFVAHNCGGMNESLQESTLFGHERGAFTGADRRHSGVFEQANGGTLFLDEVSELAPSTQAILLRALELGEVKPVARLARSAWTCGSSPRPTRTSARKCAFRVSGATSITAWW
jgi:two-component system, NtrC family, response regulator HupR/HoxA